MYDTEKNLQAKLSRRFKAEDRYLGRIEKREEKALAMVGELSTGEHYIFPVGGKFRKGTVVDLIQFLIRNNYV